MAVLDELLVGLGFDYDPDDLHKFKKDITATTDTIKTLSKVAIGAATAIVGLTVASTAATDEQGKFGKQIGENVAIIDALQFAQERAGGSSQGMLTSLRDLSIRAAEAARGTGTAVEALGILGISATDTSGKVKKSSDLILEISDQLKRFDNSRQIELADKLGIRDSIMLLQLGSAEIKNLTDEAKALGVSTEEDAAIAAEFQDSLVDLWKVTKQFSRTLSKEFAPILNGMVSDFTEWWKVNRDLIEQNIPKWIEQAAAAMKIMLVVTSAWLGMRLASTLATLITLFKGLSVASLAASASALLLPALILAGVAAIGLLAEDAKVFFEGGESFIGDMLKKFPAWNTEIMDVGVAFKTVADLVTTIWDGLKAIFELSGKLSLDNVTDVIKNLPGFAGDITGISKVDGTGFLSDMMSGLDRIQGNGLMSELSNTVSSTSNTVVDKIEIIVQGGTDSAEVIANSVFSVFQQASKDLNSAVDQ